MVKTLNELGRLRDVRFGQPWPRHGLKLLHWFANECLSFDTLNNNSMTAECYPKRREFGFHIYENRYDESGLKLLPDLMDVSYYVVGNLNSPRADELPDYVLEDKFSGEDDSNTDRIIVSLDDERFHSVYVTQHLDQSNYDPDATYKISRGLLMIIRRMSLEAFLEKTGYAHRPISPDAGKPDFTVVCDSESSVSEDLEPPAAQTNHVNIVMPETNTSWEEKGFWETFCAIL